MIHMVSLTQLSHTKNDSPSHMHRGVESWAWEGGEKLRRIKMFGENIPQVCDIFLVIF